MDSTTPATTPSHTKEQASKQALRATIVFNPTAGRHHGDVATVKGFLEGHGWTARVERTARQGDGTRLARAAAARGDDVVVVAGGDGTINEAVQGLAGTTTALGVLPLGTTNVWAREVELPTDPLAAAAALVDGDRRAIDLGRAGDRYFLLMAGLGFDGAVTGAVNLRLKRALGKGAYALTAAAQAMRYEGPEVILEMDDETVRCRLLQAVVGNTRLYGGNFSITASAVADDGLLDVVVFEGRRPWDAAPHALPMLLGRCPTPASPNYYRTRRLRVTGATELSAQVDGDHLGTALDIAVAPAALRVVVPRGLRSPLFSRPPAPDLSAPSGEKDEA